MHLMPCLVPNVVKLGPEAGNAVPETITLPEADQEPGDDEEEE